MAKVDERGVISDREVCDFCSADSPEWAYPAASFVERTAAGPDLGSEGAWSACERCSRLIEADDREGLARRSARTFQRKYGGTTKQHAPAFRRLHAKFWQHRSGGRVPSAALIERGNSTIPDGSHRL